MSKKRPSSLRALKDMVGRERLERSTSGLKVRRLTPLTSTSRGETLYPSLYNNKTRHSCNTLIIPKFTSISRQVHEICTKYVPGGPSNRLSIY